MKMILFYQVYLVGDDFEKGLSGPQGSDLWLNIMDYKAITNSLELQVLGQFPWHIASVGTPG